MVDERFNFQTVCNLCSCRRRLSGLGATSTYEYPVPPSASADVW